MFSLLSPDTFTEYELIDSGMFEKLERFGAHVIARPEPQAVWDKALAESEWKQLCDAWFKLNKSKVSEKTENTDRGEWVLKKGMPEQWNIHYHYKDMRLQMRLGLTSFKHVGIFPEQAVNWNYIYDTVKQHVGNEYNVLNLFAYTGGASLAARAAGASVTHIDSVKQTVSWSRENMTASKLDNIRWVVEDALKFVQREARRGNKYNGIILDPPAYGRGPEGEKWVLEQSINELIHLCKQILKDQPSFLILNLYSMGFSPLIAESLVQSVFGMQSNIESGELFVTDRAQHKLPLGIFTRFLK